MVNILKHIREWGAGITSRIENIRQWEKRNLASNSLFIIMAVIIGFGAGTGAWLLKLLIKKVSVLLTGSMSPVDFNYRLLFLPLIGILLTGIFSRYIIRRDISKGVGRIEKDLSTRKCRLSPLIIWANIIGNTLTLGFGGSAGSEGPIAYSGAAIGSNIGRLFNMPDKAIRILVGIGAGAGIAGIFKSPVGGVLFTLEVLELQMSTFCVIALFVACIVAALTCYGFSGFHPDVTFSDISPFDPAFLGWIVLLGIFCGLYSAYYNTVKQHTDRLYSRLKNPWVKNLISGAALSVFVFLFPAFYGEGYGVATDLINDRFVPLIGDSGFIQYLDQPWTLPLCAVVILLVKSFLVSSTTNGGGIAGDFAPTIFAGAVAGFLFAYAANEFCGADFPVCNFALVGMAAVMAGTIHAPLMAIFIVVEMSQGYSFFMPVAIGAFLSYLSMKVVTPDSKFKEAGHDDFLSLRKKL